VKALTFDFDLPRLATARLLGAFSPRGYLSTLGPLRLSRVPDAKLLGDDWVIVETRLCGICGSDVKQAFMDAALDNPLTAVISFPHVLGHEHVGTVVEVGASVKRVRRGERVACYPWLSCLVRGLPECAACKRGEMSLCESFTSGRFSPGMHAGNCRDVSGGFAQFAPVHESACFPLPESVTFDAAVLADPFSVALHAVLLSPPDPGETVLVFGCGGIGMLFIHLLARLFPQTTIYCVDVRSHTRALAERLGAQRMFSSRGAELIDAVGEALGAPVYTPRFALPWLQRGVDRIYDTVGSARTLECGLRLVKPRGSIVLVGVATPARFEWTPLYYKEVTVTGSSGYGIEQLGGRRAHAFEHYLGLLADQRVDPGAIVTHRFPLERYQDALMTARSKGDAAAVKVVFDLT